LKRQNPETPVPLFLDLTHTSHTRARTGVQRVARALRREWAAKAAAVCFDPYQGAWRPIEPWEEANLVAAGPSAGRGARWPLGARLRGYVRRLGRRPSPLAPLEPPAGAGVAGVLVPEIFSPAVAAALPALFAASTGPRVALFHDAIALQFPELAPRSTAARFPGYLRELLGFDGVAAVSEASRESLLGYWHWLGVSRTPPVAAIPLGLDPPPPIRTAAEASAAPTVLCVGTIEARKNHAALLDACESLWARGVRFQLRLIGLANAETAGPALERLGRLRAAGWPLRYGGPAGDEALEAAYQECAFTVYPSIAEGFGLPVAESLARGKPCICRTDGALGEVARGGGCMSLGAAGPAEISEAIGRLIGSPADLAALEAAARRRRFRTWAEYAAELLDWMGSLARGA
jgi:glycosyltransferase involved in cell wall biosynthesis